MAKFSLFDRTDVFSIAQVFYCFSCISSNDYLGRVFGVSFVLCWAQKFNHVCFVIFYVQDYCDITLIGLHNEDIFVVVNFPKCLDFFCLYITFRWFVFCNIIAVSFRISCGFASASVRNFDSMLAMISSLETFLGIMAKFSPFDRTYVSSIAQVYYCFSRSFCSAHYSFSMILSNLLFWRCVHLKNISQRRSNGLKISSQWDEPVKTFQNILVCFV